MTNYLSLSLKKINELLKNKTIKPIDLVNEAFLKIEKYNLNCFITLNKEEAIKKAKELENLEVDNLLFGIPIAIKDNIVTKDLITTCASKMLEDFNPIYDATVIKKIKEKNMIIIGKTNMDEFAFGSTGETSYFGNTINPFDKTLVPGGSSSGSAVSVASHIVPLSLASDTGGSIRQPSSFNGIVGMKPTYGRVSRYGLIPFASSLDCIGTMSCNVYDNAVLLEAISGIDNNDLTSQDKEIDFLSLIGENIEGMKIGIPNYYMSDVINEEIRSKVLEVKDLLVKNGAIVENIDIDYLEYAIPLYQLIALSEISTNMARYDGIKYGYLTNNYKNIDDIYSKSRSEGFGLEAKRRIMIGTYVLSGENADKYYYKALKVRRKMTDSFKEAFLKYDLIIGPTNTNVAYKLGENKTDVLKSFYDDLLTIPVNMAGLPGLSMPIGYNSNNLPIGMHIIGNYFDEKTIYKLASFIEDKLNIKGGIPC